MKAKIIFQDLWNLLDFLKVYAMDFSFGKFRGETFNLETTEEADGVGLTIKPKNASKEAESDFQKAIEQAQKAAGFVRVEQTGRKRKTL